MEAKSIESPIYEILEKKEIISEAREYELLEFLDNNEGLNIYQLSKRLGWDQNLVGYYLDFVRLKLYYKNISKIYH